MHYSEELDKDNLRILVNHANNKLQAVTEICEIQFIIDNMNKECIVIIKSLQNYIANLKDPLQWGRMIQPVLQFSQGLNNGEFSI
jgi:hypothetical protein